MGYPKNWDLDGWSGHLDSGRSDVRTFDAWILDAWTPGP